MLRWDSASLMLRATFVYPRALRPPQTHWALLSFFAEPHFCRWGIYNDRVGYLLNPGWFPLQTGRLYGYRYAIRRGSVWFLSDSNLIFQLYTSFFKHFVWRVLVLTSGLDRYNVIRIWSLLESLVSLAQSLGCLKVMDLLLTALSLWATLFRGWQNFVELWLDSFIWIWFDLLAIFPFFFLYVL